MPIACHRAGASKILKLNDYFSSAGAVADAAPAALAGSGNSCRPVFTGH
jgi:hypothetical protein